MIETTVDRLLAFLKEKKETTVVEAAQALKTSEKQIEKIANYLMEEGVIAIDYKLTGIALMLKGKKKKKKVTFIHALAQRLKPVIKKKQAKLPSRKPAIKEEKPVPKNIRSKMKEVIQAIAQPGLTEHQFNKVKKAFDKIVTSARREDFYNKTFFTQINTLYEILASKKMSLLITQYQKNKDKKQLQLARQEYTDFVHLQEKLQARGYSPNLSLRRRLRKVLKEAAR